MISFIVPAHNEQACLPGTLQAIHDAARVVSQPYEIIVVDDASTDATPEIARQNGARVVSVTHRQIAATRNSGGRAARGERFFFVDADTTVNAPALAAALRAMDKGAVGGGAPVWTDELVPLYIRVMAFVSVVGTKLVGFTGGAFMFCRREAFQATGGFSERLYWAEEGSFALALKREGRFVVIWNRVLTSGRRFRKMSALQLFTSAARMMLSPTNAFTRRSSVEKVWYDSNREGEDKMSNSLTTRISNGIAFLLVLSLITAPILDFVPWSWTPLGTPVGKVRFANATFLCHVGLLFWPIALVLVVNLVRQKRWTGLFQSTALIAFCLWNAWGATGGVIRIWTIAAGWITHLFNG